MSPEGTPRDQQMEELRQRAVQSCERITEAANLMGILLDLTETVGRMASTAQIMSDPTFSGSGTFGYRVKLYGGVEAHVVDDNDTVVEENPREFIATELSSMGRRGVTTEGSVEFRNRRNRNRLVIEGLVFDIEPVLLDNPDSPVTG